MANDEMKEQNSTSNTMDDLQRIKVLSPGRLVAKRFFRNRLAVIGLVIISFMIVFSFIGGVLSPYSQSKVFKINESILKDYAGVAVNTDYQFINAEGETFPAIAKAQLILAINKEEESFTAKDVLYSLIKEGEEFYRIVQFQDFATVSNLKGINRFNAVTSEEVSTEMKAAYESAVSAGETSFELNGRIYYITKNGKNTAIAVA